MRNIDDDDRGPSLPSALNGEVDKFIKRLGGGQRLDSFELASIE